MVYRVGLPLAWIIRVELMVYSSKIDFHWSISMRCVLAVFEADRSMSLKCREKSGNTNRDVHAIGDDLMFTMLIFQVEDSIEQWPLKV